MTARNLNLFGEEISPEQTKAVGKSRAKPKESKSKPEAKQKSQIANQKSNIKEGWKADKQYYSIGEVANLFNVKTSNIRFWTNEFGLKVRTTRKGDRLYNAQQIKEIKTIYHLVKERGFTIAGAKTKMKSNKKGEVEAVDLKQSLLQLRNKLVQIRNKIS
jgi:DNA-binding transcriptional MerR regulator